MIVKLRKDGIRLYYEQRVLHRLDKPAVENPDGSGEAWIEGERQDFNYQVVTEEVPIVKIEKVVVAVKESPKPTPIMPANPRSIIVLRKKSPVTPVKVDKAEDNRLEVFVEKLNAHIKGKVC